MDINSRKSVRIPEETTNREPEKEIVSDSQRGIETRTKRYIVGEDIEGERVHARQREPEGEKQ